MKLKYYMRGLGIGIILTTLILTIGNNTISDKEVIRRANALGMSFKDEEEDKLNKMLGNGGTEEQGVTPVVTLTITPSPTDSEKPASEFTPTPVLTKEPEPTPTLAPEKETEPTAAPEPTSAAKPTKEQKPTEIGKLTTAPKSDDSGKPVSGSKISFTIKKGMGSGEVADVLVQAGVIKDAADFNQYIIKAGQAGNIKVGAFKIKKNASYEDIIKMIILD